MSVYKRREVWVADFYLGGRKGRRVRRAAPTKELAEAIERDGKVRELKGELGADQTEDISLLDFIKKYIELYSPTKSDSSRTRDGYTIAHVKRFFRNPLLRNITRERIEKYMSSRSRIVSKSTVNTELDLVKSLLNRAVDWGYLRTSPAAGVKKYRLDEVEPNFLTPEEGMRLIEAAVGQMKTFIVVGLNTGMRKGEMFQLKWADIDFRGKELRVRKSKGRRFRLVPMNESLYHALRKHPRHITSPYVFHNSNGTHWHDIRHSFNSALDRAGLPRVRIHDLRHSFVSALMAAGEDPRRVQELAGHRDIRTTMKYAHLRPNQLRESVEKLRWG